MANPRSATHLFNNPLLSDVTIKQIYKGKVREYHAHKAILCADSSYLLKAFTGNFKESSENVMEIHDDDPDQFKFLLKYYYTYDYDEAAVDRMAGGKPERRLLIPIGIHALADKYDIQWICNAIADDLRKLITNIQHNSLRKLLDAHYATVAAADGPLGELLISHVLKGDRTFMHTTEYKQMLVSNPVFGAGMALALERNIMDIHCSSCFKHSIVRRDVHKPDRSGMTAISCSYCRAHVTSLREN